MPGLELPELVQRLTLETSGFKKGVEGATAGAGGLKGSLLNLAKTGAEAAAPLLLVGGAAVESALQVEDAMANIQNKTGATGEKLKGLKDDFEAVGRNTPSSFKDISDTLSAVTQRFHLAGPPLQQLTEQILNLNRITHDSLGVNQLSIALAGFKVPASQAHAELDKFYKVSQQTQVPVSTLIAGVTTGGPAFRQFGLGIDASVNLLGKLSAAGVPTAAVLGGLKKAFKEAIASGEDGPKFIQDYVKEIEALNKAGDAAGAKQLAIKLFGPRGAGMVDAIASGKIALADFTNKALPDFANGINATSAKTLTFSEQISEFKNKAELSLAPIGEKILPVISGALDFVSKNMTSVIVGVGLLGTAFTVVKVGEFVTGISEAVTALTGLEVASSTVALGLGGVGLALGAGVIAYKLWTASSDAAKKRADDFAAALEKDNGKLGANSKAILENALKTSNLAEKLNAAGVSGKTFLTAIEKGPHTEAYDEIFRKVLKLSPVYEGMSRVALLNLHKLDGAGSDVLKFLYQHNDAVETGTKKYQANAKAGLESSDATKKHKEALDAAKGSTDAAASSTGQLAASTGVSAAAAKDAAKQVKELKSALDGILGVNLSVDQAQVAYLDSVQKTTDEIAKNGKTIDINTAAGRLNRTAIDSQTQAAIAWAKATITQNGNADQATKIMYGYTQQLDATLRQAGLNTDQVNAYNTALGLTPDKLSTLFVTPGAPEAAAAAGKVKDAVTTIPEVWNSHINVDTLAAQQALQALIDKFGVAAVAGQQASLSGRGALQVTGPPPQIGLDGKPIIKGHALGGAFPAGAPILVGEKGPELLLPHFPGVVATAETTAKALDGGSGGSVNVAPGAIQITVNGDLDGRQMRALNKMMDDSVAQLVRQVGAGRR